ncbi:hypothetical protein PC116_g33289 [Phytophthora cactorum]|nr:hypothetical protein PC116_g33289 [Phytophthora cactorum]
MRMARSEDFCNDKKILSNNRSSAVKSGYRIPPSEEANDSPDRGVADVICAIRPVPFM